jgi:hypothetical protein
MLTSARSNFKRASTLALVCVALTACASGDTNTPTGATQLLDITLQPARIPPRPDGALMLSAATGCYVEYVGKGAVEPVYRFKVAPTKRTPSLEQCIASLRIQPGVTGVEAVR